MADYKDAPLADQPQAFKSVLGSPVPYSGPAEALRSVGQGLTFGTLDEIEAALRTGSISGPEYEKQRNLLREQQKQFGMDMPIVKTSAEIGGSLIAPLGIAKQVAKLAPATQSLITGETVLGQVGRGTAIGAVTGAASGYGFAEKDEGSETAMGGAFGGVLGGSVPIVVKGAGTLIKNVLNSAGIGDQEAAASKMLANYLKKDNLSPTEAQQALDELRRIGVPNPVIADLGKSLNDLAYSAYVVQSKAKGSTKEFLENRLIDQPNDMVKGLVEKAGLAKNVNGFEYLEALAANQSRLASQAYPEAYSKAIDAVPFRKFVDRDVFVKAYQEAVKRADVYGKTLPELSAIRNAQSVPTDILHQIKIGLDRVIDAETDTITKKVSGYGRDVTNVKNEFNDLIKSLNPEYKKANAEFADSERIRKAFNMGEEYQTLNPAEAASKIKKMTSDEKEAFRLGVMADVNQRLGEYKSGDFTKQIFKSENQKLLLRNAFPDQASYTEFSQYVKGLNRQAETKQRVLAGSRTDENQAVREQANLLGSLAQAGATGDLVSLLRAGGSAMLSRAKGISSESSEALQKRLFSVDPVEQTAILQELNKRARKPKTGLLTGAAAVGSATGIVGD
jgi:predicted GIY-YIG superfamily endonuclease